jgi:hypothetical protein
MSTGETLVHPSPGRALAGEEMSHLRHEGVTHS